MTLLGTLTGCQWHESRTSGLQLREIQCIQGSVSERLCASAVQTRMVIFLFVALLPRATNSQIVYFYEDLYLEDSLGNSLAQGVQGQNNASLVFEATQLLVRNFFFFNLVLARILSAFYPTSTRRGLRTWTRKHHKRMQPTISYCMRPCACFGMPSLA